MRQASSIAAALRRGATIVAASPRASRALHLRFAHEQRETGQTIWPTPAILDWESWLRALWRDHAFVTNGAPTLLTRLQERALWLRAQGDDASLVISPDSLAALAMEAWSLLSAFNAHSARRDSWEQTDAERFRHWAATFEQLCARNQWLSAAQLESALLSHLVEPAHLTLPSEVVLIGFDRITPAQQDLLSAFATRGVVIARHQPEAGFSPDESHRSWLRASVLRDEIAACAAWARDLLIANPAARIGVIAPDIASARGLIDRTFRRVLLPASEDISQPSSPLPWEFSLGQPLDGIPAIRAALLLLRWTIAPLPEEHISWLMLSGFVADTVTNPAELARHDARQRRLSVLTTERSLASYRESLLRSPSLRNLSFHLNALSRSAETARLATATRLPSAMADLVPQLLARAGWPGSLSGDSIQFQGLQRWQRLLDELAFLDLDNTRISWTTFLDLLARQAQETIFAPESHDAPIQIVGPFEASGQQFDALWFLGADDTAWPQRGRLHPLLPAAVQRQFEMPHFSPQDDWNFSHIATSRLLASAPVVVFSCAERDKDAELRPSPLIASLFPAQCDPDPVSVLGLPVQPPLPGPGLEIVADDSGVLPWPVDQIAGGAGILRSQAACPFQAFASRRLRAEPLDEPEWGIGPLEKGSLLHDVMQRIFSAASDENVTVDDTNQPVALRSRDDIVTLADANRPATLRSRDDIVTAIDTNQLDVILGTHIDAAIAAHFDSSAGPWQQACLAAEKRRLLARIRAWLELESRRQPFAVEACEQCLDEVHVGDLRLRLRADRIDLLPDASRLLLDYKTGMVSPSSWDGDRPTDPQLPLYAVYGNIENLSGVLFARIKAGKMNFEGSVRDARAQLSADIPAKKALVTDPYSDTKRDQWARALGALAQDFLTGGAAVQPQPGACKNCRLHSLCRIAERESIAVALEDTPEEDADA